MYMKQLFTFLFAVICMAQTAQAQLPAERLDTAYGRWRAGGYGEMLLSRKDYGLNRFTGSANGSTRQNHADVSIPRFVLAGDYKISKKWILSAEIEFEAGGTGMEYEMEAQSGSENGEYETEMEKGGEVALEQFHLTRLVVPEFNVRVGHLIMPVGLVNTHHEPLNFFGAARPEGATTIMASTWHETGVEFFGEVGKGLASFDYEALITAGLNPNGFDIYNWVKKGKQGFFETDNFSAPAYTLRVNWKGVRGLRVGGSVFYNPNAGKNADKLITYDGTDKINVLIYNFDAQYIHRYFTARFNYTGGNITNTVGLTAINKSYSSLSPYSRKGPVAKRAVDWFVEAGADLKGIFSNVEKMPALFPFVHYNYYNTQESVATGLTADNRCQVSLWTVGVNYRILPNLVAKLDYTTRQIGTHKMFGKGEYNSENEIRLGLAYNLWVFR